ncbi:NAD(P)-binding domain-containing protein [Pseudooceanicola sp. LIPI14-2-Ac024]|uniref:NAD(P)-binding domain-containing protein n=1 Tax=Pseudooceanicola sp. LIPI14-2-Ac024 TaxID=3344875 RepID=UPI0035CFF8DA
MRRINTLIIGAGQAGLAMSHCLTERAVPHAVLERGEVANSWKADRWDSLRLLTPNWQSRLPGHRYGGADPDGFMSMPEVVQFLETYAAASQTPVETGVRVAALTAGYGGFYVETDKGSWLARNVVVATGACAVAAVPGFAHAVPGSVDQLTPLAYKSPQQVRPGGVLVVGGSATGLQLAAELHAAGHEVILSTGEHIRTPRHYRGRDIHWWMEATGLHATPVTEVDDVERVRRLPSLQLIGSSTPKFTDLSALQARGVEVVGRLATVQDGVAKFSGALANHCALSDHKMNRLLDALDTWAEASGPAGLPPPERFAPTRVPPLPRLSLDLRSGRIATVLWATGFRPDHRWIDLPVFDRKGRLVHDNGAVAPGLHVLGLPFMRRRNSALIDGVGKTPGTSPTPSFATDKAARPERTQHHDH